MKIAITDDIKEEREHLCSLIYNAFDKVGLTVSSVSEFDSGEALLNNFNTGSYDLIILDMFMDGLSGYEIALKIRQIDNKVRLIFCTTSNDFASESYEVGACYYLHKPVRLEMFIKMLTQINFAEYEANRYFTMPNGQRVIPRRICYTEYLNHLIYIHYTDGETVRIRATQTVFEDLIREFGYLYVCSKGIVVNFFEAKSLNNSVFLMNNGVRVPVSRRKLKETEEAYTDFRFERTRKEVF